MSKRDDAFADVELFKDFQLKWNREVIERMTIEQYTSLVEDGSNDHFTRQLEHNLDVWGTIWGGSSYKFGIYKCKEKPKRINQNNYFYDGEYAWNIKNDKNGSINDRDSAFEQVKSNLLKIYDSAKVKDLPSIESINMGDAFKWKLAFHFQGLDQIAIIPVYKKDILKVYLKSRDIKLNGKFTYAKAYKALCDKYNINNLEDAKRLEREIYCFYLETKSADVDDHIYNAEIEQTKNKTTSKNLDSYEDKLPEKGESVEGKSYYKRNPAIGKAVIESEGFLCCIDPAHKTFQNERGNQFMEAHHIIPISFQNEWDVNIDCRANVVSLCPNCHRQVHNGNGNAKRYILNKLFNLRVDELGKRDIRISCEKLLSLYGC
ncbi:MAG: HNH endonuclease [Pseudomonadota bacterium]|nr:HNH endonuclease [Pseudomonadota bacterium]